MRIRILFTECEWIIEYSVQFARYV